MEEGNIDMSPMRPLPPAPHFNQAEMEEPNYNLANDFEPASVTDIDNQNVLQQQRVVPRNRQELTNVNNEYNRMVQNGETIIPRYDGTINLNLEMTDLFDLTLDEQNNPIPNMNKPDVFLQSNPSNIIFILGNHMFFTNRDYISRALNDDNMIKFGCNDDSGRLNPQNIVRNIPYISYKFVGLYSGLVTVLQNLSVIKQGKRIFYVTPTNQKLPSTVSLSVLYGGNRVGASHCQEGQGDTVYTLSYVDYPLTGGRNKRRTRRAKKIRKERKTNKNKKNRKMNKRKTRKM